MSIRTPYVSSLELIHQGKVRDSYAIPGYPDHMLMVATDAISTYNVSHVSLVPQKGQLLTALSLFWANERFPNLKTHITAFGREIYDYLSEEEYPDDLHLRSLVVRKLHMVPYELIGRARMAGSLWSKYYSKGLPNPYGIELPDNLELMSEFDGGPIFTPTDKSVTDEPVPEYVLRAMLNPQIITLAMSTYDYARNYALSKGIDIIDFKIEVGLDAHGYIYLADEWLNGDCCRFVKSDYIEVGKEPEWADKEIFRQDTLRQWDGKKEGPPLVFSPEVIEKGLVAYHWVFRQLTGRPLAQYQAQELM